MFDKVDYWLDLCEDDLITAKALLEKNRLLHMGFVCHLIIEKAFKATIAKNTNEIPPRIHDLQRLATFGGVFDDLSELQLSVLDKLTPLQIQARYPEYKTKIMATLTTEYCKQLLDETEDLLCWIKKQLEN
ncbi:MAG: HEPN domain-containing protein [Oscillospiraceae bacterium]|nr:HEPN domain-containing protein [Oscillospiraceae bacterium]